MSIDVNEIYDKDCRECKCHHMCGCECHMLRNREVAAKALEDAAVAINAQDATQGCALAPLWRSHNFVEWLRARTAAIRRGDKS